MARIKDESVRAVVAAADMVDVVSAKTALRRVGGRFTGRCPFHEERTPSFSVNPADKLYYCFGCGSGGDVVKFVRETENLDFVGAIELLAERFRVPIEYEDASPEADARRTRRERLFQLLELATGFFERHLWETAAGEPVRAYLGGRNLREDVVREFRLGLSPGRGVVAKARERGFTLDELRAAGLANARGNDYFPRRLMFPLADARGRVIGFQARKLHDDDPLRGKYVNSPEGELFHKSAVLYGLHLARQAMTREERAVIVEGNTDVIALRQSGLESVVASMGTALTQQQLGELNRLARRLYLCFDADAAGQEATLRGMKLAADSGFDVRVVSLPPGADPADAPDGFADRLARAESYVVYHVRVVLDRARDRQEAYARALEVLNGVPPSPERQDALRLLGDRLDLPRETLTAIPTAGGARPQRAQAPERSRVIDAEVRRERTALAACVAHEPLKRLLAELTPEHFDLELHRRFQRGLVSGTLADERDLTALHAELDALAQHEGLDERTGTEALLRLRERRLLRDVKAADDDLSRAAALQAQLLKVRMSITELA